MIIQITANKKIIGGVEVTENKKKQILVHNKTEALSIKKIDNTNWINDILNSDGNVLDIDISNDLIILNKNELQCLMSCKNNWVVFEENRKDFSLNILDDWQYAYDIIEPLKTYHILSKKQFETKKQKLYEFLEYDGKNENKRAYQYDKLDYFLSTLHPLLDMCLHY